METLDLQIADAMKNLYAAIDLLNFHDLVDMQRELGFIDLQIQIRMRTLADAALMSRKV